MSGHYKLKLSLKKKKAYMWVLISSTVKVSDGWIRDLKFNFCLHQKLIGVLNW